MDIKINRGDWTGKDSEIRINKSKNTVFIPELDETLKLKFESIKDPVGELICTDVIVYWDNSELCRGQKFSNEKVWHLYGTGVERESENVYEVAAQMAFNLI